MKVLILDDEFPAIRKIRTAVQECFKDYDDLEIIHFINVEELLKHAVWFRDYDIACLDINVQNIKYTGIDVAKKIKVYNVGVLIIFITIHTDYYKELVNAEPFRFVLKEELEEELPVALKDARRRLERCHSEFRYKVKRKEYKESMDDIMYMYSAEHRYIYIQLVDGRTQRFIAQIDEVEDYLRSLKYVFFRANKSYIINPIHIEYEDEHDVKINGITISKTHYYHIIY